MLSYFWKRLKPHQLEFILIFVRSHCGWRFVLQLWCFLWVWHDFLSTCWLGYAPLIFKAAFNSFSIGFVHAFFQESLLAIKSNKDWPGSRKHPCWNKVKNKTKNTPLLNKKNKTKQRRPKKTPQQITERKRQNPKRNNNNKKNKQNKQNKNKRTQPKAKQKPKTKQKQKKTKSHRTIHRKVKRLFVRQALELSASCSTRLGQRHWSVPWQMPRQGGTRWGVLGGFVWSLG